VYAIIIYLFIVLLEAHRGWVYHTRLNVHVGFFSDSAIDAAADTRISPLTRDAVEIFKGKHELQLLVL
jgi:hypothetical protein